MFRHKHLSVSCQGKPNLNDENTIETVKSKTTLERTCKVTLTVLALGGTTIYSVSVSKLPCGWCQTCFPKASHVPTDALFITLGKV
jgi:hypothetical protein